MRRALEAKQLNSVVVVKALRFQFHLLEQTDKGSLQVSAVDSIPNQLTNSKHQA